MLYTTASLGQSDRHFQGPLVGLQKYFVSKQRERSRNIGAPSLHDFEDVEAELHLRDALQRAVAESPLLALTIANRANEDDMKMNAQIHTHTHWSETENNERAAQNKHMI